MNNRYANCSKCGILREKRRMRPIYSASSSSMPPHLLGYLCNGCYCLLLDTFELKEGER